MLKYSIEKIPLIDTRSESEFKHASIPGAVNIPLLRDEERKAVGTIYKQKNREAAIMEGFRLTGPRFHEMISECEKHAPTKDVMMYCWRGGMRSQVMSWLMELYGFKVTLLKGGYKAFRNWTADIYNRELQVMVLGGPTGSGKSELLDILTGMNAQVIDLEKLANHKGSAFGGLGKGAQPSNEHFENSLAIEWFKCDSGKLTWLENESRSIGSCMIPEPIFNRIRNSHVIEISVSIEQRMKRITEEYGCFPVEDLRSTTLKIKKRLGPQHVKESIQLLEQGDFNGWLAIILDYYDRLYDFGSKQREPVKRHPLAIDISNSTEAARKILNFAKLISEINSIVVS